MKKKKPAVPAYLTDATTMATTSKRPVKASKQLSINQRAKILGQRPLDESGATPSKVAKIKARLNEYYAENLKKYFSKRVSAAASDHLPHSHLIDPIVRKLNNEFGTSLTGWHVWELLMELRKNGKLAGAKKLGLGSAEKRRDISMYDSLNILARGLGMNTLDEVGIQKADMPGIWARLDTAYMHHVASQPAETVRAYMLDHWPYTHLLAGTTRLLNHANKTQLHEWHVWEILIRMRKDDMLSFGGTNKQKTTGYINR